MKEGRGTAIALYLLAVFLFIGFLGSDAEFTTATAVALLIGVGLPTFAATRMLLKGGKGRRERQSELRARTVEAEVLRIAKAHEGKLTIVEIVSELAISQEEAQATVDSLVRQQIADIEITESGVLVYAFRDIKYLREKPSSRNILE
ncbi:MAG TPA: hypothetical protein VGD49_05700 [Longimicrobiales bacterium]